MSACTQSLYFSTGWRARVKDQVWIEVYGQHDYSNVRPAEKDPFSLSSPAGKKIIYIYFTNDTMCAKVFAIIFHIHPHPPPPPPHNNLVSSRETKEAEAASMKRVLLPRKQYQSTYTQRDDDNNKKWSMLSGINCLWRVFKISKKQLQTLFCHWLILGGVGGPGDPLLSL